MTRRSSVPVIGALLLLILPLAMFTPVATGQTNLKGQWTVSSYTLPTNPVHAALLKNGKILIVTGSGNCPPSQSGCPSGPPYGQANSSGALLLDPTSGNITRFSLAWDMFCNSMTVLSDGRVFINGGTIQYDPFFGQPKSSIFDPANNSFTDVQNMAHGRWYPTVVELGDGRVMTWSGTNESGTTNTAVEIYTVGTGWSTQFTAPFTPPLYPRLHLLPNGKVFYSGWGRVSALFDPSSTTWTQNVATTNYGSMRSYGSSVMLALTPANGYDPKIMTLGGNSPATATTEIIDMGAGSPAWAFGPSMSQPRIELNAVILPTGQVLAVGGSTNDEDTGSLSLNADLYSPGTGMGTFSSAGTNATQRLYHSVALLLPDATVWLAGGNPGRGSYNNTVEIYQPPYLFQSGGALATRPSVASAPSSISYGGGFTVQTPDAANISSVVLVKNSSVTHAFNMDQRVVGMSFTKGSGSLSVTAPPNGNIAPPGYYMLFLLNSSGVPSIASMVKLGSVGAPAAPTNVTATAGNAQVALGWTASSGATSYNVKRSTTSGGPYTTVASPTTNSYTNTGLTNGTTYYYVVTAVNGGGESANSSQVSATPAASVPAAPTNVTATAGNAQVALSWTASTGATSYNVKRSTTSGGPYTTVASPTTNSYTNTGLTNGTTYYYVVTAVNGGGESANSSQVSATPSAGATSINYGSGFTSTGLQRNGSAALNGTRLRLTDTATTNEAGSAFYTTAVNVQSFTTDFSLQLTSPNADGMTFVIQNNGATALGPLGGGLGYGPDDPSIAAYTGMNKSVAVKFDMFNNVGEGVNSTGLYTAGVSPTTPAIDLTSSGVNLHSGDVFNVHMTYDGTTLAMSITDATTAAVFSTSWTVNIPTAVGGSTALVGFTGGTGGLTAVQDVLTWTYTSGSTSNPPATPTNVTATAGNAQVALRWTASSGATSYNVKRSTTSGGPYTTVASPTTNSYTNTGLTNGTTYYYVVSAVNGSGESANSSQVSATPAASVPAAPTNVTATAGNAQVALGWTASSGATSYNVKRSTTSGGPYTTVASPTTNSYTNTGLTNGTTYYYVVTAVNGGGESANSSQVSATPAASVPAAPTNVTATAGNAQVALSWTASTGATSYNVKRSTTSGGPYTTVASPTTNSYTNTGLTNGTTYYYVVTAVNGGGESANSSQASATPSAGATSINYGSGFTSTGLQRNGSAALNGTRLRLTDTATTNEAGSAFYTTAVNVQSFTTDFSLQLTSPNADGMTFVIQNNGATALGPLGGGLGYGPDDPSIAAYTGMNKSVAVKFDMFNNVGEGVNSTGLYTAGVSPTTPAIDLTSSGVNLHSGDAFNVHMTYDGTTLAMSITDATTAAVFSTSWTVNIPTAVGGSTALVGFTGGTGGLTAVQDVLTWTYSTGTGTPTAATPTFSPAPGNYTGSVSVTLSDSTPGAVIHCTTDGTTVTSSSPACTTVSVTTTTTIQALATASGFNNSAVASGTYTIGASSGAAFVQVNSGLGGAAATSVATAYTALQTVGDLNIVVVGWYDTTAAVSAVTDTKGNSYTLAVGPTKNTAGGVTQSIYYAKNIASALAGSNTVTVSFSTGAIFPDVRIFEYRGLSTTSPLDVTAALSANGGAATSGAATTTVANELIFGAGTSTGSFTGPGAGFTQRVISGGGNLGEDMVVTAIGSYAATAPNPGGGYRVMQMATFK